MTQKYVIQTSDGAGYEGVFLSWTNDMGGYYTTVDSISEICKSDIYSSVAQAESRAKDADSGTWGGWRYPMVIMQVMNYEEVILNDAEPDMITIKTIDLT